MPTAIAVTEDLRFAMQRDLYAPPKWAVAFEVQVPDAANNTLRFMDAAAMSLNGPRELHGFEFKVSRADWLGELRKPEKSRPALGVVDKYWLLAGAPDVFKPDEVPEQWGIIAPNKTGRLTVVRQASYLQPKDAGVQPWPRCLMSAFVARATNAWEQRTGFVARLEREAEARGQRKGRTAAMRQSPVRAATTTKKTTPTRSARPTAPAKMKYNPGRYNFDDGEPLDLP